MRWFLAAPVVLLSGLPALAQGFGVEVRAGAALTGYTGVGQLLDPFANGRLEDVGVDLIWAPPINPLFFLGSPGLEAGATANLSGGESFSHANLLWHLAVPVLPLYLETGLGVAMISADPATAPTGSANLACPVMPYVSAGVGVDIGNNWSATVGVENAQHFGLCGPSDDDGVTTVGAKVGFRF